MPTARPTTRPCPFEPDYFAELATSLAKPFADEQFADPPVRQNRRWRTWGPLKEEGYRTYWWTGHLSPHNLGRKPTHRK